ncbi:MAG TPA: beta-ketoacyl-ACP synthase II [Gammaproteobacteria bacterium]|nr:beta-ketoacyl-ACP synthase II [Gammaproteobacteria bacterium]
MSSQRRVVVTGMGMLSAYGNDVEATWQSILAGVSKVDLIKGFDASQFSTRFAAEVIDFDCSAYLSGKEQRKMDLFVQFGVIAAAQALKDSGLEVHEGNSNRVGVAIGSGIGGITFIETNYLKLIEGGPRKISPFFIPGAIINMCAGYVSMLFNLRGPNISIVTACTTGVHNIGMAMRMIQYGDAEVMLAGGAEKSCTQLGLGGFCASRALSTRNDDPKRASRPWDKDRDGFVMADGAGVLVLEEFEHAKRRGAKIYAEVTGFGMSADAHHVTMPPENGQGAYDAMQNALNDAGLNRNEIQYINAHGTSTAADRIESYAIERLFTTNLDNLAVSSTKSMTGHLLGAAGAVESIFSILAIRDQVAPPTINLDTPEEGCVLNYVPNVAQYKPITNVISNSFGFGGTNGSLIFSQLP